MNRRDFLKNSALASLFAAGGCSAFNIGRTNPRRPLPSERVNLAVIGCGAMGNWNMAPFMDDKRVQVTVTCDPVKDAKAYGYNKDWAKKWRGGRVPFAEKVDKFYGRPGCRAVADWREVIDDPTVDAVLIATPDHWHAIIAIAAMKAGKHVYCQKPMTMSIAEGRRMCEVAAESGVVFQVGSQQRSSPEFREAAELVRNKYLGDCRSCTIGLSYAHNDSERNGFPRDKKPRRGRPGTGPTTRLSRESTARSSGAGTTARATGLSRTGVRTISTSCSGRSGRSTAGRSRSRTSRAT